MCSRSPITIDYDLPTFSLFPPFVEARKIGAIRSGHASVTRARVHDAWPSRDAETCDPLKVSPCVQLPCEPPRRGSLRRAVGARGLPLRRTCETAAAGRDPRLCRRVYARRDPAISIRRSIRTRAPVSARARARTPRSVIATDLVGENLGEI